MQYTNRGRLPLIIGLGFFTLFSCGEKESKQISDPFLPEVLVFAGDTIPLDDPEIRERLERELWINTHWEASTALWVKKSGRWFPLIDSLLRKNQVPQDFRYLVPIESSFDNVTSNKGAVGFWQLMEPTAREFGLRIDEEVDERLHPAKATEAACKLILRGKSVLGKWPETAVSYNIGVNGLKSVMTGQYTDSFYDLLINPESGRYLFRILAAKLILSEPERYGYGKLSPYFPLSFKDSLLTESIPDLPFWCRNQGFSFKCFRQANPWIKARRLTVADSLGPVVVSIPKDCRVYSSLGVNDFASPDSLTSAMAEPVFRNLVEQKDIKGLKEATREPETLPEFHRIGPGESLGKIALKYGLTQEQLLNLNPGLRKKQDKIEKGASIRLRPANP